MVMRRANSAVAMIKRVIRKGCPSPRRSHYERRLKLWCSVMDQTHYESMVHGSGIRLIGKVNGKKVSSGPYLLEAVSNGLSFRWRLTGRVPVSFFPKCYFFSDVGLVMSLRAPKILEALERTLRTARAVRSAGEFSI